MAAADEPSPPPCGMQLTQLRCRPGQRLANGRERRADRPDHEMLCGQRNLVGADAGHLDHQTALDPAGR